MTEATAIRQPKPTSQTANLSYQVAMSQPASHLFEVTLHLSNWQSATLDLKMPVWTPGSYLVREYARHLQDFKATSSQGDLSSHKLSKNHWQVEGETNTYVAQDFDTLVDTPFEVGTQRVYNFEVLGTPHSLAIWSQGNANPQQIIADTTKVIETEAAMFGGLPYKQYLFLLHLSGSGYGGLEHKDCCTLNYPRFGFRDRDKYQRFIQLVAHEFFHLWNVKRIRPQALEKFNYEGENYTTSLWFCEGTTSYYDILIPLRAGIYNRKTCLKNLSKDISKYLNTIGRTVQPLGESSYDAWIKLYRRNANSDNNQISYYLKGQFVSLLLDLLIRAKHQNKRSLDDVMSLMWQRFGQSEVGFSETELRDTIAEVAAVNLDDFFSRYIETTEELPFDDYLAPFGLYLKTVTESDIPYLGIKLQSENNREVIQFVAAESPAALVGIDAKDELLAIDGIKIDAKSLNERLKDYQAGDTIQIVLFHQDELQTLCVTLDKPQSNSYELVIKDDLSPQQQQNLRGWLGQ